MFASNDYALYHEIKTLIEFWCSFSKKEKKKFDFWCRWVDLLLKKKKKKPSKILLVELTGTHNPM